ncbi:hypothetical protein [Actinophytocola oryzae]|uniref:Uncharacterized protein n=1 Tax=Actinophytocola oryzae TaxID=502181 RepID=A0A4R7VKD5_9PSEU|nr:hypothetical protein [Actinophytocola oryzae]TDV49922.1 hypothetical protein CLV71_107270 [Actinophytocola oryzae]
MSGIQNETAEPGIDAPAGRMRLLPSVTFGVRAAALARVALPVAMVTASLVAGGPAAGAESYFTMDTTCCPPQV